MFLAFLDGFEIVFVAFASAVDEFLACLGRRVVKVAREKRPAVSSFGRLAAAVGAFDFVSLGVDERDFALIARIGDAEGVRVERTAGVEALIPTDGRLDTWVGADGPQSPLFQDSSVRRTTDRSSGERVVDWLAGSIDAPTEFSLALLPGVISLQGTDGRRDGHHQRSSTSFCIKDYCIKFSWANTSCWADLRVKCRRMRIRWSNI